MRERGSSEGLDWHQGVQEGQRKEQEGGTDNAADRLSESSYQYEVRKSSLRYQRKVRGCQLATDMCLRHAGGVTPGWPSHME